MLVAVSGTPGVGKSSACGILADRGHRVINLNEEAVKRDLILGKDEERGALVIDTDGLSVWVRTIQEGLVFLDGHISHLLDVDIAIVLRCDPNALRQRLNSTEWSPQKIAENVEAEAIDVILVESLENRAETFEIDTTNMTTKEVADAILRIAGGDGSEFRAGSVDWSEVILGWY